MRAAANTGFVSAQIAAGNFFVSTTSNTPLSIDALAHVLATTGTLTIADVGKAQDGSVSKNSNNTLEYTPTADFLGFDKFAYIVSNGIQQAARTIMVNVMAAAPLRFPSKSPRGPLQKGSPLLVCYRALPATAAVVTFYTYRRKQGIASDCEILCWWIGNARRL